MLFALYYLLQSGKITMASIEKTLGYYGFVVPDCEEQPIHSQIADKAKSIIVEVNITPECDLSERREMAGVSGLSLEKGDDIYVRSEGNRRGILCKVIFCKKYMKFEDAVADLGPYRIYPQATSEEDAVSKLKKKPHSKLINKVGCIAFGIIPIEIIAIGIRNERVSAQVGDKRNRLGEKLDNPSKEVLSKESLSENPSKKACKEGR